MGRKYTCAECGEENESEDEWSEAAALAEKQANFGDMSMEDMDIVCEDCYQKIMKFNKHPGFE